MTADPSRAGRTLGTRQRPCRTATLAELGQIVGADVARDLAFARRKARRAAVPAQAPDGHWLVRIIGREATDKLCTHFRITPTRGVILVMPALPGTDDFYKRARLRAAEMTASGLSISTIAGKLGVSMRAVEKWRAAARPNARSPEVSTSNPSSCSGAHDDVRTGS